MNVLFITDRPTDNMKNTKSFCYVRKTFAADLLIYVATVATIVVSYTLQNKNRAR